MLLRVLFLCFALAVLGDAMLASAAALAASAFRHQGVAAAAAAFSDAQQRAQSAIAAAVSQSTALPAVVPAPAPTCVLAGSAGCALVANENIAVATPQATSCPSDGCAAYAQENDLVAEGRAVADIETRVTNPEGDVVALRSGYVAFRTLRVAPYALVAGAADETLDDAESGTGEFGGMPPSASSNGTFVDIVYRNASSGATLPANVWSPVAPDAPAAADWSP